ncbi:RdgB/HAM1 family non-canonical purine NTP pyrophosphatase [Alteromonas oceanisediminis]|uniref:RdgB/HAM1 family non-canonical purine NTP pyrophosphatase n=1 Tax=Alteromonas oceanisediminis TaxID=2836180 RepID=UPI001BDA1751|nr:RdgB/HAM1 family non-canonical purine NTP pyrophosphatase [Alteromonas oceanisediminis]MBT0585095.1 RdgB/HAM1 family non-canonical purine NTP pyrophosphatase [Alteromonas oceanisediminis]
MTASLNKLVLATGNSGKVKEFTQLFAEHQISIVPQTELKVDSVPETGTTFVENAIIKARHAAAQTGLPAIADDSGLVVDALGGAPGIYSSRYALDDAGEQVTDEDNINKLLRALNGNPQRTAHFYCCLVFMRHADDPVPLICEGRWYGEIATERSGMEGFGYDPVFYVPQSGTTAAQMSKLEKNSISHRGKALSALVPRIAALKA